MADYASASTRKGKLFMGLAQPRTPKFKTQHNLENTRPLPSPLEGIPTAGTQRPRPPVFINQRDLSSALDFANSRDLGEPRRAPEPPHVSASDGKEQFVVVAAVEGHFQRARP